MKTVIEMAREAGAVFPADGSYHKFEFEGSLERFAALVRADALAEHYTSPPAQRTWVGLTELEKAEITSLKWWDWEDTFDIEGFIRAIEAKLKEKNT